MADAKSTPILFSGPMVRAIIEGRKSQTRRIVKPEIVPFVQQTPDRHAPKHPAPYLDAYCGAPKTTENPRGMTRDWCWWTRDDRPSLPVAMALCVPGDELWVRETWKYRDWTDDGEPFIAYRASEQDEPVHIDASRYDDEWGERLAGIWASLSEPENYQIDGSASDRKWRSPRFMPRWASRLTLTVKAVRVEKLQDISREDAMAEGIPQMHPEAVKAGLCAPVSGRGDGPDCRDRWDNSTSQENYSRLWESINGPGSWDANPWVWCYSFSVKSGGPRG